jgi:hypothetical protein
MGKGIGDFKSWSIIVPLNYVFFEFIFYNYLIFFKNIKFLKLKISSHLQLFR